MSLSEKIESASPVSKFAAVGGLFVLAAVILWWGTADSGGSASASGPGSAFYSVDDGATWFKDSADLVPPFQHDGKTANQVVLFSSDGGKTKFAGYMQRFNTAVKKQLDAGAKVPRTMTGVEVKRPGEKETWLARNSKAGMDVVNVKSPAGKGAVEEVVP